MKTTYRIAALLAAIMAMYLFHRLGHLPAPDLVELLAVAFALGSLALYAAARKEGGR